MREQFALRLRIVSALILAAFLIVGFRLYQVQIVRGEEYRLRAERQYIRPQGDLFNRGTIYFEDKDGNRIDAAAVQSGFTLALNPQVLGDIETAYDFVNGVVPVDKQTFVAHASKESDPYEVIARRLSKKEADQLAQENMPGIIVHEERWRYYPGDDLAPQVIGFVGFNGDELDGRYGLERYYNDVLERDPETIQVNFFAEMFGNIDDLLSDNSHPGDVVTTIEPTVQAFLEGMLSDLTEEWYADSAGALVIDPQTGQIYALALEPRFNLNRYAEVDDPSVFDNPIVESVFEMGSIIKPITMAIGLDTKSVTADTTYNDRGFIEVNTARISNYDGKARGVVPMQEVLNQSLNTGAAFVQEQVGNERFADYMLSFGLDEETGIDLPGEIRGLLSNLESPRDVEYRTASFGQGVATTPIATVRALAALGNGGRLITPHIVKRIEQEFGPDKKIFYDQGEQVIAPETSEEITRMLVRVVDEALLGGTVKLPHHSVAAKTGTAQIASPDGGYYDDRFFHSFFGYFPAYDPEFLVFLYVEEPVGARYASETLTMPFIDTTKFLINYYNIPPDR